MVAAPTYHILRKMKREAFIFFHCSYGILRVIKIEDKLYYSLADIIRLFQLTPLETFNAIADSAGEVKLFYVDGKIVKADSVFKFCRIKKKRGTQIEVPYYYSERLSFVDELLMKDLQVKQISEMKFVYKWADGFIKKILQNTETHFLYGDRNVENIEEEDYDIPLNVRLTKRGLLINGDNPKNQ